MPDGGMASGAPVAPSVDSIGGEQTPQPYMPPPGMGQIDPNQSTTKPRQMPNAGNDNGGPPGVDPSQSMDPAMNGAEGGPANDVQPNQPPVVQDKQERVARILAMMRVARKENPDLTRRQAYDLAKAASQAYPIVVQAEGWRGLDFGNRGRVRNGPLYNQLLQLQPQPGEKKYQPRHAVPGQVKSAPADQTGKTRGGEGPASGVPTPAGPPGPETGPAGATPGVQPAFTFQDAGDDVDKEREQQGMIPRAREQVVNLDQPPQPRQQPVDTSRANRVLRTVERGMNVAERGVGVAERVAPLVTRDR